MMTSECKIASLKTNAIKHWRNLDSRSMMSVDSLGWVGTLSAVIRRALRTSDALRWMSLIKLYILLTVSRSMILEIGEVTELLASS